MLGSVENNITGYGISKQMQDHIIWS